MLQTLIAIFYLQYYRSDILQGYKELVPANKLSDLFLFVQFLKID